MNWKDAQHRQRHSDVGQAGATGPRRPRVAIGRSNEDFANTTAQRRASEEGSLLEVVTGMTAKAHEEQSQLECIMTFVRRSLPIPERFHELARKHGIPIEGS